MTNHDQSLRWTKQLLICFRQKMTLTFRKKKSLSELVDDNPACIASWSWTLKHWKISSSWRKTLQWNRLLTGIVTDASKWMNYLYTEDWKCQYLLTTGAFLPTEIKRINTTTLHRILFIDALKGNMDRYILPTYVYDEALSLAITRTNI